MSLVSFPTANNFSKLEGDWWADVAQEDTLTSLQQPDSTGVWSEINFVPPPPRPLFLEDIVSDGITTCDLCVWAWKESTNPLTAKNTVIDSSAELGWLLCLVIVSVISALLGAILMTIILHCKRRMKNCNTSESTRQRQNNSFTLSAKCSTVAERIGSQSFHSTKTGCNLIWCWCSRKDRPLQSQLEVPTSPAENHYTHIEDSHNAVNESIYTELDSESPLSPPCYQNAGGSSSNPSVNLDIVPRSPSSSLYSDLSIMRTSERGYEVVGLPGLPKSERIEFKTRPQMDLPSIINCVSDYI